MRNCKVEVQISFQSRNFFSNINVKTVPSRSISLTGWNKLPCDCMLLIPFIIPIRIWRNRYYKKSNIFSRISSNFTFWAIKNLSEKNLVGIWKQEFSLKSILNKGSKIFEKRFLPSSLHNQKLSQKTCRYLVSKTWETPTHNRLENMQLILNTTPP